MCFFILLFSTFFNTDTSKKLLVPHILYKGEAVEYALLPEVIIIKKIPRQTFQRFNRIKRTVFTCYPYVRKALQYMEQVEDSISQLDKKRHKRRYIRQMEKDIKEEFSTRIKNMTLFEGKILLKLLYRESGKTGYDIIKYFKSGFSASIYQGIARLFGGSLKYTYDPENDEEDKKIEAAYLEAQKIYGF